MTTETGVRVRPLTAADIPACVALQQRTFPSELWEDGAEYETLRSSHELSYAVKTAAGAFVGYLMAHWCNDDTISELAQGHYPRNSEQTAICIHDFVLDPSLHGRGVGRYVICSVLMPVWRAAGAQHICLLSVPTAIGFWSCLGFDRVRAYTGTAYPAGSLIMKRSLF